MSIADTHPTLRSRVADYLAARPNAMTMAMARDLDAAEADIIRALPEGWATPLAADRFGEMMHRLESFGPLHVIVSNGATTLEAFGTFGNFSTWGEYFNVQTKSLDMHVRPGQIGSAFAVRKPGHLDGAPTLSIQFYSLAGDSAFKVFLTFGGAGPSSDKLAAWNAFCLEFAVAP